MNMDTKYYNVKDEPFTIHGLYNAKTEEPFKRLPDDVAAATSMLVTLFHTNTAGGRVRFKTDSSFITLKIKEPNVLFLPHMALSGTSGFDLYVGEGKEMAFCQISRPPANQIGAVALPFQYEYESTIQFNESKMRDILINFPLYNDIDELSIGLQETAAVEKSSGYRHRKPVLFYGSSITQGACATRPGSCYSAILSRRLDFDYINLGFGGSALGEDSMAEYIAGLDLSVFVCDYDHNAPDVQHLAATHPKLYMKFRAKNPDVPVIFMTKPDFDTDKVGNAARRAVVYETYRKAVGDGDQNVYFIDGETFYGDRERDACTVDGCHPNDLGHMKMADAVESVLKKALRGE
jgi:hypothetical protein